MIIARGSKNFKKSLFLVHKASHVMHGSNPVPIQLACSLHHFQFVAWHIGTTKPCTSVSYHVLCVVGRLEQHTQAYLWVVAVHLGNYPLAELLTEGIRKLLNLKGRCIIMYNIITEREATATVKINYSNGDETGTKFQHTSYHCQ